MASEWVKLTVRHAIPDGGAPNAYMNLTNASSIFHQAAGGRKSGSFPARVKRGRFKSHNPQTRLSGS